MIVLNLATTCYVISTKPFTSGILNFMDIFNELALLGLSYHLLLLTDYLSDLQLQYYVGFSMIGLCLMNFFVNILLMIFQSLKGLIRIFKRAYQRLCKRIKKNKNNEQLHS